MKGNSHSTEPKTQHDLSPQVQWRERPSRADEAKLSHRHCAQLPSSEHPRWGGARGPSGDGHVSLLRTRVSLQDKKKRTPQM